MGNISLSKQKQTLWKSTTFYDTKGSKSMQLMNEVEISMRQKSNFLQDFWHSQAQLHYED